MFKPPVTGAAVPTAAREPGPSRRFEGRQVDVREGFNRALERALNEERIRVSRHARERIQSRRVRIDESDVRKISDTMDKLQGKGAKISLLFVGDTTLVTNVERRTVITAVDSYANADKVFTQIDSAAVIEKA